MAKRTMDTMITITGGHRPVSVKEILGYKGWPRVAAIKATEEQLREVAKEILDDECIDHQDFLQSSLYD